MTTMHVKVERSHMHNADIERWWIEYSLDDSHGRRHEWWYTAAGSWLFWLYNADGTVADSPRRFKRHRRD